MTKLKYSRQRESIKEFLSGRFDHPTADTIYSELRDVYPNISLGTVYRNLSLLEELGEISKISTGDGPDRYDGNSETHYHFVCTECHRVEDLEMENIDFINDTAAKNFNGEIHGHITHFYGKCGNCTKKQWSLKCSQKLLDL